MCSCFQTCLVGGGFVSHHRDLGDHSRLGIAPRKGVVLREGDWMAMGLDCEATRGASCCFKLRVVPDERVLVGCSPEKLVDSFGVGRQHWRGWWSLGPSEV